MATSIIMALARALPISTGVATIANVGAIQPTEMVDRRGVQEALYSRTIHVKPANVRSNNISKAILGILVDTLSQAVQPEMRREESRIIFLTVRIHV
jgi:hypothetical protein